MPGYNLETLTVSAICASLHFFSYFAKPRKTLNKSLNVRSMAFVVF